MAFMGYPSWWESVISVLFLFFLIGEIFLQFYLAWNKKWTKLLGSVGLGILSFAFIVPAGMIAQFSPDGFGKDHPIPKGLVCNEPIELDEGFVKTAEAIVDSVNTDSYLQIYRYTGGSYKYDFSYSALPKGRIYLKCYEITENIPLSTESILSESTVPIDSTYSFSKLVNWEDFTIYEGEWDDFYAVRVEVWHQNDKTGEENKLMEKIYKMDGWMR